MKKLTHRYQDVKISMKNKAIVDTSTGEIIPVDNSTLFKRTSTGEITIHSQKYVYLDTINLTRLMNRGIKQVDLALLFSLSSNLLINYNICIDNQGQPLNTASIAKLICNKTQPTKRKLNSLINQGLLFYGNHNRYGKVYIVNPYIIRKGRNLSSKVVKLFYDIE